MKNDSFFYFFIKCVCLIKNWFYLCTRFYKNQDSVAQPVEQRPFKPWVLGSNPSRVTKAP